MTFTVPGIPPSYNKMFKVAYNIKQIYLSREANEFKKKVMLHMPPWDIELEEDTKIQVDIWYHANWYYKNGKMKRKDVQNLDKLILDAIFQRLGIDDKHVWINSNNKVQDKKETKTVVTMRLL